jgi:hypothetical protein
MMTDKLTNPTVRAAVEALQQGDRTAWVASSPTGGATSGRISGSS